VVDGVVHQPAIAGVVESERYVNPIL